MWSDNRVFMRSQVGRIMSVYSHALSKSIIANLNVLLAGRMAQLNSPFSHQWIRVNFRERTGDFICKVVPIMMVVYAL